MNENRHTYGAIPAHLFEIIPKSGQYLKSIMELTGYNNIQSISRLKDPKELQTMFDFAADVADGIPNREEIYGIFSKNPKSLRLLPGIEEAFKSFLNEVHKLKPPNSQLSTTGRSSKLKRKAEAKVSIQDVEKEITDVYEEHNVYKSFQIISQNDSFLFTCLNCNWQSVLVLHDSKPCFRVVKDHLNLHCLGNRESNTDESFDVVGSSCSSSKWNSRTYRNQTKLMKASSAPGQTKITEFFDIDNLSSDIDNVSFIRQKVNKAFEAEKDLSVKPILKLLFENAVKNSNIMSKSGYRHNESIKMFGAYLFCLIGRAGYDFLLANLGVGLPSLPTVFRMINETPRIKEGEFLFDKLLDHLNKWKAPKYVNIHMDDTRVLNKVEYDPVTRIASLDLFYLFEMDYHMKKHLF